MFGCEMVNASSATSFEIGVDYIGETLCDDYLVDVAKPQRVQNCLARVTGARHQDHIKPVLKDLHWLPIRARIRVKITTLIHKVRINHQSSYLVDLIMWTSLGTTDQREHFVSHQ